MTRSLASLIADPPPGNGSFVAPRAARSPPLCGLTSDSSGEPTGSDDAALARAERQHGEPSRRRAVDDARAIGRVESRRVTRAEQRLRLRVPHRDRTPLVRADGGVRDHAAGSLRACLRTELRRVE